MKGKQVTFLWLLVSCLCSLQSPYAQTADTVLIKKDTSVVKRDSAFVITDSMKNDPAFIRKLIDSINQNNLSQPSQGPYTITGTVKDRNTGEGIPFALVFFPGSPVGTSADLDGNFELRSDRLPGDSLHAQAVGYQKNIRIVDRNRKTVQYIIELERAENLLNEVVVHAGEDPALVLLKRIIQHKPQNNPDKLQNYRYEVYNKLEVDLERLSKKQFERIPVPMTRKFSFIYDNLDTVSENTPFLPFYLTETLSDYYFQRDPKKTKEFIKASITKGLRNESVTKFLGSMYQNVNCYDNFIPVFDKDYVSPVSNSGAFYYKYRIIDTQQAYGHNIILVQFEPRRSGENCFFGDFWVVDSVYALQRISMEVPRNANINWVSKVSLYQEYAPIGDSLWFYVKDKFYAHFTVSYDVKLPGFIGRKTTSYRDVLVNDPVITAVVNNPDLKQDVYVADTAINKDEAFWSRARHDSLSYNEKAVYKMIDSLESLPLFTTYKNFIKFVATGIKEVGPLELGPYWYIYSSNPVEGSRFRLSLGTTSKLFKDIYLNGYVAYGTRDERFKYKAAGLWLLQRHPRMFVYASYTHDIDRSVNYYDEVSTDNLLSIAVRKPDIPWKLAFSDEARLEYFKEYFSGFMHQVTFLHKTFDPYSPLPSKGIFLDKDGMQLPRVVNTEVNLRLRYAWKEKFLEGKYYRVSLGSKYPIAEARYSVGLRDVLNGNYHYQKITLSVSDDIKIAPLGALYMNVFAGKYFGTLPYPLLEVHPGNEFYYYNKYAFNMMNRFEFISDEYAGINLEHTIGGGVFNYIPYLKKLKLRQFWTAKGLIGSLSEENRKLNLEKGYPFKTLEGTPYIEIGTGVENILRLFRIDFVWRVTPPAEPAEPLSRHFGIFGSVRFRF